MKKIEWEEPKRGGQYTVTKKLFLDPSEIEGIESGDGRTYITTKNGNKYTVYVGIEKTMEALGFEYS